MTVLQHKAPRHRMTPNLPKILESVLFVIGEAKNRKEKVTQYEIVKTIFLADRAHLNKYGRPITFDNYSAMRHGPVPSATYDLLKGEYHALRELGLTELPWSTEAAPEAGNRARNYTDPVRPYNEDLLSPSDVTELTGALTIVKQLTFAQLRKLTHEDAAYLEAWGDAADGSYDMSLGLLFEGTNFEEAENLAFLSEHA